VKLYQYAHQVKEFGDYWDNDAVLDGRIFANATLAQDAAAKAWETHAPLAWGNYAQDLPAFDRFFGQPVAVCEANHYLLLIIFEQTLISE